MTALRLPLGAPVKLKPPWWGQRPVGWLEPMGQGVPLRVRAPQMRLPISISRMSTVVSHSWSQERARGVPIFVELGLSSLISILIGTGCCHWEVLPQRSPR